MTTDELGCLAADLLEGADAIAAFLNWSPRRVRYLAALGVLPVFRFGDGQVLNARRSTLRQWIERLDAAALNAAIQAAQCAAEASNQKIARGRARTPRARKLASNQAA